MSDIEEGRSSKSSKSSRSSKKSGKKSSSSSFDGCDKEEELKKLTVEPGPEKSAELPSGVSGEESGKDEAVEEEDARAIDKDEVVEEANVVTSGAAEEGTDPNSQDSLKIKPDDLIPEDVSDMVSVDLKIPLGLFVLKSISSFISFTSLFF